MQYLIKELQKSGAITIKKVPEVILSKTIEYPPIEIFDLGVN